MNVDAKVIFGGALDQLPTDEGDAILYIKDSGRKFSRLHGHWRYLPDSGTNFSHETPTKRSLFTTTKYVTTIGVNTSIPINVGMTYTIGSNQLLVFMNGMLQTCSSYADQNATPPIRYDYYESATTQVQFYYDIPPGAIITFVLLGE